MKESPLFQQDLRFFIESRPLSSAQHRRAYADALSAAQTLERKATLRQFPFLEAPFDHTLHETLVSHAARFREFKRILIIGTPKDIASIRPLCATMQSWVGNPPEGTPHLFFLDRLDSDIFWDILSIGTSSETGLIVISPEGDEPALLIQLMRCIEYWMGTVPAGQFQKRYLIITKAQNSPLCRMAKYFGLEHMPYPAHTMTCFSEIALLPAMIINFNARLFFHGAAKTCDQFFLKLLKTPLQGACLLWASLQHLNTRQHLLFCSASSFDPVLSWYQETWKLLLGPYRDMLTHSRGGDPLIEGIPQSAHNLCTFFVEMQTSQEALQPELWEPFPKLKTLARSSLSDLMKTHFEATRQKLIANHQPFRVLRVNRLNEESLGGLFMGIILEMLLVRELLENASQKMQLVPRAG